MKRISAIDHSSLFPEIDGIAKTLKLDLEMKVKNIAQHAV